MKRFLDRLPLPLRIRRMRLEQDIDNFSAEARPGACPPLHPAPTEHHNG